MMMIYIYSEVPKRSIHTQGRAHGDEVWILSERLEGRLLGKQGLEAIARTRKMICWFFEDTTPGPCVPRHDVHTGAACRWVLNMSTTLRAEIWDTHESAHSHCLFPLSSSLLSLPPRITPFVSVRQATPCKTVRPITQRRESIQRLGQEDQGMRACMASYCVKKRNDYAREVLQEGSGRMVKE